jgi:hypothetical protein
MKAMATHNRVGIFHSVEVQEEVLSGEWIRNTEQSTKQLPDIVNDFLSEAKATALFVSPPTIELVGVTADKKVRTYRCSVSVIYRPIEVIDDQSQEEGHGAFRKGSPKTEEITLNGVPAGYEGLVFEAIRNASKVNGSKPRANSQVAPTRRSEPGVAKAVQAKGGRPPVQRTDNGSGNRRRDGRSVRRLPRNGSASTGAGG